MMNSYAHTMIILCCQILNIYLIQIVFGERKPNKKHKNKKWKRLQILTHPIWWTQERPRT